MCRAATHGETIISMNCPSIDSYVLTFKYIREHYVFQLSLFQHRFLEQLNVTKIWSLHLRPIYLPAIVVIVQYRLFSVQQ